MPRWILRCDNCNNEFTHSMIPEDGVESFYLPQKPDMNDGVELECPHCGVKDTYDRTDLVYRG